MLPTLLFALAAPAVAGTPAPMPPAADCRPTRITYAKDGQHGMGVGGLRKLGDQPPARHYLAVARNVGGCPAPAVVRSGIGIGSR